MAIKQYAAFTPPSPYEQERRKAEQMRRYAELLQEQAMAEDEPYTYQGIRAMPSPAAALGKLLKAYGAKKASEKADEAEARKTGMEQQASQQIMGRLFGGVPMSQADTTPDESGLAEVAVQSQYRQDPTDAMRFASTPQGAAAVKGNPMLAAMLQRQMEAPAAEEFYAPVMGAGGNYVQFGKRGNVLKSDVAGPQTTAAVTPTTIMKNGKRVVIDARTGKEIGEAPESSPLVVNYGAPVPGVDEQGNPVFFQPSRTGGDVSIVPGVRPSPKGMNEAQAKAAGFADRIAEATPLLDKGAVGVEARALSGLPGGIGNFALTPDQQTFLQAERNFVNSVLRRESGAVISEEEFANARQQYIPQPGDSAQVLEQKRRNRETVKRSFMRDAGPSYQPVIDLPPRR